MKAATRRRLNKAVNILTISLLALSFMTGWAASLLSLTEFGLHKYTSIALVLLASVHLAMHWRALSSKVRRREPTSRTLTALAKTGSYGSSEVSGVAVASEASEGAAAQLTVAP